MKVGRPCMNSKTKDCNAVIIGVMLSGSFIAVLNQTVLSPALPSIMRELRITAIEGQWLTTAFMLVNGIMIPVTAYLINRFTTRQIFLSSMVLFAAGTLLAGFSRTFLVLLIARILQAMAAGVLMPMVQTVILLLFPREERGSAMGTVGIVMAFAPAVGPPLSGWFVDAWGWNSIFLAIAPLAALDVICGFVMLKNVGETKKLRLDHRSVTYSTLGLGGILYGSSNAGGYGWDNPLTLVPLLIGIVFVVIFVRRQLRVDAPLLELRILRNKIFRYSTIVVMILYASLIAGTIMMPIYLQDVLNFSALKSGMIMLPGAIAMGVMSPVTGHLFDRYGPRAIAITGLSIMTLFSVFFVLMDETWCFTYLCLIYTARMFGMSLVLMPLTTWGLNDLENNMIAHGSAIINTARQVAGSIGAAILITIMVMVAALNKSAGAVQSTLHGMHVAFGIASILAAIALIMAILFVGKEQDSQDIFCD